MAYVGMRGLRLERFLETLHEHDLHGLGPYRFATSCRGESFTRLDLARPPEDR